MSQWTLYDRDWNADQGHEEVAGEVAVFRFPRHDGETPAEALARWVKAIDHQSDFDYSDAHTGTYEVVSDEDELCDGQLVAKLLRLERCSGYRRARAAVYALRSREGAVEVRLDPFGELLEVMA